MKLFHLMLLNRGKKLLPVSFIVVIFLLSTFSLSAQKQKIVFSGSGQTLRTVFKQIEQQAKVSVDYDAHAIDADSIVTDLPSSSTLDELLKHLLKNTNCTYSYEGTHIIIAGKRERKQITVSGVVSDIHRVPIIGANIVEKGSSNGTITDIEGAFSITVPEGSLLQISYIGYLSQTIKIDKAQTLSIYLKEDTQALEEVVVTALGIKREEKALGYSVQKMSGDEMPLAKSADITVSLTGKVAGLNIQNNTEFDQNATISLRGATPIIIVDGIPYANISINEIAADDIESIDVLKGATASALYGARGTNGAIMITTKKGSDNEGLNINVNSNTMFFSGYLAFPEVQHSYSAGTGGKYNNNSVWGDKLDIGRTAVQWDPETYEYREMELTSKGKDNFKNFLQFSMVTNNNVSVTQKGKYGSFRASATQYIIKENIRIRN